MPSVAFIVHLNLPDVSLQSLEFTADAILDDLQGGGHDVTSVEPWQRPSLASTQLLQQEAPPLDQGVPPPSLF